ncbi:MAG: hypothetical protein MZV70_40310 [Desulfobacterales bacterium]|nr:hypothetical protein [Desulfobacterales bacterium]
MHKTVGGDDRAWIGLRGRPLVAPQAAERMAVSAKDANIRSGAGPQSRTCSGRSKNIIPSRSSRPPGCGCASRTSRATAAGSTSRCVDKTPYGHHQAERLPAARRPGHRSAGADQDRQGDSLQGAQTRGPLDPGRARRRRQGLAARLAGVVDTGRAAALRHMPSSIESMSSDVI